LPVTEGGNGLSDITLDPRKTLETKLPLKQKELLGIKDEDDLNNKEIKIDNDGIIIINEEEKKVSFDDNKDEDWEDEHVEDIVDDVKNKKETEEKKIDETIND
jgi:hypothetical protein